VLLNGEPQIHSDDATSEPVTDRRLLEADGNLWGRVDCDATDAERESRSHYAAYDETGCRDARRIPEHATGFLWTLHVSV